MPFATADKSESPLDRAWAMGEKLISSKELMDPGKKILFSKYMFPRGGGGGRGSKQRSFLFVLEAVSVHENEIVRQATHRRVVKSTQHAPWVRSLYYLRSDRLLMTQRLFTSNVLRYHTTA